MSVMCVLRRPHIRGQKAAKNSRNAGWEPGKYRELSVAEQERSKQDMERTKKLLAMMKEEE